MDKQLENKIDQLIDEINKKSESVASASAGLPGFDMPHTGKPFNKRNKKKKMMKYYGENEEIKDREYNRIMIDFDGVIHSYHEGFKDGTIYGYVIDGAKEFIDELRKNHQIVIFTTRASKGNNPNYKEAIKDIGYWLNENDIYFDFITGDKLPAIIYIDDNAIRFENNWKEIKDKIKSL
ncbi:MAG: hypothetical protein ACOC1K_01185 [Nanoarchaeota archaeon]